MDKLIFHSKIGQGSSGEVLLVKDKQNDQQLYALKRVLNTSNNSNNLIATEGHKRLKNEINLLKTLQHPNIINYYESIEYEGQLCFLMEYADSGDLQQIITNALSNETYLSETYIMKCFVQICLAVYYLHSNNILHRDIKAQNIFLTFSEIVKLGDFGISKQLENTNVFTQTIVGTPYYLSPEICKQEGYDTKSDMWMLGCLLYELCALQKPFQGDSLQALINNILSSKYKSIPSQYNLYIHQIIDKLLEKNSQKRINIQSLLQEPTLQQQLIILFTQYPDTYKHLNKHQIFSVSGCYNELSLKNHCQEYQRKIRNKEKLAQYSIQYLIKKTRESQSPVNHIHQNQQESLQKQQNEYFSEGINSSHKSRPKLPQKNIKGINNEYYQRNIPSRKSYQRDIQINTQELEPLIIQDKNTHQKAEQQSNHLSQLVTTKINRETGLKHNILFKQSPIVQSRSILLKDFMKEKLGVRLYEEILKIWQMSKIQGDLITEQDIIRIIGQSNRDYIKLLKQIFEQEFSPNQRTSKSCDNIDISSLPTVKTKYQKHFMLSESKILKTPGKLFSNQKEQSKRDGVLKQQKPFM